MPEALTRRRALGAAGAGALFSTVVLPPASAAASPAAPAVMAPGAPTQVEVAEGTTTAVLSWTAGTGTTGAATYTVEHRARGSSGTWTAFAGGDVTVTGTTATAILPSSGSQLEYRVSATEGGLTSAPSATARPVASGGDAVVLDVGDAVHTFTTVGPATLTLHADRALEALVVGGGGGGGGSLTADNTFVAGGGGAGGFLELTDGTAVACVAGDAGITVGAGGAATQAGGPSTLVLPIEGGTTTRTATGGGGGRHVEDGSATVSSGTGASGGGGVATADTNVGEAGEPPTTARNGGPATASAGGPSSATSAAPA